MNLNFRLALVESLFEIDGDDMSQRLQNIGPKLKYLHSCALKLPLINCTRQKTTSCMYGTPFALVFVLKFSYIMSAVACFKPI